MAAVASEMDSHAIEEVRGPWAMGPPSTGHQGTGRSSGLRAVTSPPWVRDDVR